MFSSRFIRGLLWLIPALLLLVATVEKAYFESGLGQEIRLAQKALGETAWDPEEEGGTVKTVEGNGRLTGRQMRRALEGDRSMLMRLFCLPLFFRRCSLYLKINRGILSMKKCATPFCRQQADAVMG